MPTAFEEYTLTEVSKKLNVPDAWVRRWEKALDFKGSSGQQGKRSYYTEEFINILRRVYLIQALGYGNREILRLWNTEISLKKLERPYNKEKTFPYPLILASPEKPIYLIEEDFKDKTKHALISNHNLMALEIKVGIDTLVNKLTEFSEENNKGMDEGMRKRNKEALTSFNLLPKKE